MIPKYRGLSIDEKSKGEWRYGYLIEDNGQAFIINEVIEANEQYITIGSWCPVDPKTVGQSTGLLDKNGKEFFDGDILTDGHTTGNIRNHPTLGFYTVDESSKEGYLSDTVGIEDFEEAKEFMRNSIEVIGNIYENPELLEVE